MVKSGQAVSLRLSCRISRIHRTTRIITWYMYSSTSDSSTVSTRGVPPLAVLITPFIVRTAPPHEETRCGIVAYGNKRRLTFSRQTSKHQHAVGFPEPIRMQSVPAPSYRFRARPALLCSLVCCGRGKFLWPCRTTPRRDTPPPGTGPPWKQRPSLPLAPGNPPMLLL